MWLTIWTVACYFLALTVYDKWRAARGGVGKWLGAMGTTLFALPFFVGEIFGAFVFGMFVSVRAMLVLIAMGLTNALFYHLLKAPTLSGRKIMDQVEGFKLYLSVAEQERLNLLNPPEKTPALFEKYLPYALALNVENTWSEQFAEVLAKAGTETQAYSPIWYSGSSWDSFHTLGLPTAWAVLCRGHFFLIHRTGVVLGERRRRVFRRRGGRGRRERVVVRD